MLHPTFGVLGVLAALWVFVEVLNISPANAGRLKKVSLVCALLVWLSFLCSNRQQPDHRRIFSTT